MVNGVSIDGRNGDDNAFFAGDVTARLGYAVGTWMAYVKGGFAFVDANNNNVSETIFWNPRRGTPTGNPFDTFSNGNNGDNWS